MEDNSKVLDLAYEAGAILLENGAEISRVEETMRRIAEHYGVEDKSFFVLSNGIMASGKRYSRSNFIPIKGTSLDKVVAVNQLSREVEQGGCDLVQLEQRLVEIRNMKAKPAWEQVIGSAIGSAGFCIVFGGGFADSIAAFVSGLFVWLFMLFVGYKHFSRIAGVVAGSLLATVLCGAMYMLGLGSHLSNMIMGSIIPLIPGVPFTNGVRDIANEDYIAGVTRLLDAMLMFFCIALGVALAFLLDASICGSMRPLEPLTAASETSGIVIQLLSAFFGTMAFAVLFGVPRKFYVGTAVCGVSGWLFYLLLTRYACLAPVWAVFISTAVVALVSLILAILRKCPVTVFLVCGIFPLVPGAGIFWTSYNIVSDQFNAAMQTGSSAIKITVAIVFGILAITELNGKNRIGRLFSKKRS